LEGLAERVRSGFGDTEVIEELKEIQREEELRKRVQEVFSDKELTEAIKDAIYVSEDLDRLNEWDRCKRETQERMQMEREARRCRLQIEDLGCNMGPGVVGAVDAVVEEFGMSGVPDDLPTAERQRLTRAEADFMNARAVMQVYPYKPSAVSALSRAARELIATRSWSRGGTGNLEGAEAENGVAAIQRTQEAMKHFLKDCPPFPGDLTNKEMQRFQRFQAAFERARRATEQYPADGRAAKALIGAARDMLDALEAVFDVPQPGPPYGPDTIREQGLRRYPIFAWMLSQFEQPEIE